MEGVSRKSDEQAFGFPDLYGKTNRVDLNRFRISKFIGKKGILTIMDLKMGLGYRSNCFSTDLLLWKSISHKSNNWPMIM